MMQICSSAVVIMIQAFPWLLWAWYKRFFGSCKDVVDLSWAAVRMLLNLTHLLIGVEMCGCCWIWPIYPWSLSCVDVAEIATLVRDLSYTDRTTHGLHLSGQNGCRAAGGWSSSAKRWACEADAELLLLHWPTNPTERFAVRLAYKPQSMFCSETGPQTPEHVLQRDWPTNPTACSAVRLAYKAHSMFCSHAAFFYKTAQIQHWPQGESSGAPKADLVQTTNFTSTVKLNVFINIPPS